MSDEVIQALPENTQELYNKFPLWTKIAFAVTVFGGFLGSLALILKKSIAKPILIVSLIDCCTNEKWIQ